MFTKAQTAFHGAIEELPGIYVDNFENAAKVNARAYFLSHCHADHMHGLSSEELMATLKKSGAKIYTTELSAAIIKTDVNKDIGDHVQSLKMGGTQILSFPSIPEQNIPELLLTVTLIPAGHSAGSTMFLFRTTTKTILFTGDFRMNPNDLPKYSALHDDGHPIKLTGLYVDTTFLSYNYDNFPKRSESIEKMCSEIKKWLSYEQNAVALHTSAKYGYEFAFNEIYRRLGLKVHVPTERWNLYSSIQHLVPGVTNESTKIHLCKKKQQHDVCVMESYGNYLHVRLSAMKWTKYRHNDPPVKYTSKDHLDVCFATHCSRSELLFFIRYMSPTKVIGFPNPYRPLKRKIQAY
ncbi:protein artemis-like [Danaus plexippus]|uniref:protein artemis-like n=1 Tax=Danaus plexippus TaxID=13037 RepID=UPI002AB16BC3|nr:protein artemis-like [Danaus plexippus]